MVKLADAKATAIIALQGIVVAVLGSNLIDRIAAAVLKSGFKGLGAAALATLLCTLASLLMGMLVLLPRTNIGEHVQRPQHSARLVWIDDLKRFKGDSTSCAEAFAQAEPPEVLADFAYENLKIAWLLRRKFHWLPWSLRLLAIASVGWSVTLVWAMNIPGK